MTDAGTAKGAFRRRYGGLDLLRVVSAAMVCMFHSTLHLGCAYGALQSLSKTGYVYMTAFFLLSGFSLYLNWSGTTLSDNRSILSFWKKRFLRLVPIYWLVGLVCVLLMLALRYDTLDGVLLLAPIEILGLQSLFHSLFGLSHNSATWFVSCILVCYAAYPFLQERIKQSSPRTRWILLLMCAAILLYAPVVSQRFHAESVYSDPFFRLLEFTIGMLLAALKAELDKKRITVFYRWPTLALTAALLAATVTIAERAGVFASDNMFYGWICLPCFSLLLLGLSGAKTGVLDRSRLLRSLSDFSYAFFLAQIFSFECCKLLFERCPVDSNRIKILLGWSSTVLIAILIHGVEGLLNKLVKSYTA